MLGITSAKHPFHLGKNAQGAVVHTVGSKVLAAIDIGRIHPERVFLFPPVQERRLSPDQSGA